MSPANRLIFRIVVETAAVLGADFLLLRIWGPNLVNLHQDWALAASVICLLAAVVATGWLALQLRSDLKAYAKLKRDRPPIGRIE